ncbi:MAG: TonB-dependent receptor [Pseudomonadota bacterium]
MRNETLIRHLLGASALSACLVAGAAQAQVDEIVVTAQRTVSTLQDTPVSIAVFDADALIESSVSTVEDLAQYSPNVVITNNSNISSPEVFIRGVGSAGGSSDISVGFYIDDVFIGRTDAIFEFFDVERVEILRGPQGTLYGRNTIGGAVNVITKLPPEEFEALARMGYASFDEVNLNARIGAPISDRARASLSLGYKDGGGYIENLGPGPQDDLMDKGVFSGRFALAYDLSDTTDFVLRADYSDTDVSPIAYQARQSFDNNPAAANGALNAFLNGSPPFTRIPANGNPASLLDPAVNNLLPLLNGDLGPFDLADSLGLTGLAYTTPDDPYVVLHDQDQFQKRESWGLSGTLSTQLGGADLVSVTAYRERDTRLVEDTDGTPFAWAVNDSEGSGWQVSQEFRLSNAGADRFEWLLGAFFYHEEGESEGGIISDNVDLLAQASLGLPAIGALGGRYFTDDRTSRETTSYAGFARGSYALTDRLSIEGGLRYTYEEKSLDYAQFCGDFVLSSVLPISVLGGGSLLCNGGPLLDPATGFPNPAAVANFAATGIFETRSLEDDFDALTPEIGLNFEPTPDSLIYGKVSRGFKSGGFDARSERGTFDPEFVWAYQAGFKTRLFENRLQLNAEAFYYDHTDLQVRTVRPSGQALQAAEITANGGDSTDYGFEVEFIAAPFENFTLSGGVGYVNAEYGEFLARDPLRRPIGTVDPTNPTVVNLEGNRLINTPEWSTSLVAQYDFDLASGGVVSARGEHQYKSEYFFTEFNEDELRQPGYNLFNARLSYTTPGEAVQFAVYGRNLGDELYFTQRLDLRNGAIGAILATPARPRTWGAEVIFRY